METTFMIGSRQSWMDSIDSYYIQGSLADLSSVRSLISMAGSFSYDVSYDVIKRVQSLFPV
jgi:hypothetical protein